MLSMFREELKKRNKDDINVELVEDYIKFYTPSTSDTNYQPSTAELETLCRRTSCKVELHRWNPLHDYLTSFQREGRLQNKSTRYVLKLLTKAVNKHQTRAIYSDEDMQPVRNAEWRQRKKDNLLSLRLWEYDAALEKAAKAKLLMNSESEVIDIDDSIEAVIQQSSQQSSQQVEPEGMSVHADEDPIDCREFPHTIEDEVSDDEVLAQTEPSEGVDSDVVEHVTADDVEMVVDAVEQQAPVQPALSGELEHLLMHSYVDVQDNSKLVSVSVELINSDAQKENTNPQESRHNLSVDNQLLKGYMNLHTESMTLSTQSIEQSHGAESIASFDSVPMYDNFSEYVLSATSTQSEKPASQAKAAS